MTLFEMPDDAPNAIKELPREKRGFPFPFFVAIKDDGTRDIRFACARKHELCVRKRLCWVCGKRLGATRSLLGGPLSLFNMRWSDLPCHPMCSEFSAKYCPHLNNLNAKYRNNNVPEDARAPDGLIMDNPGVYAQVTCKKTCMFIGPDGGPLVRPFANESLVIQWWHEGRKISQQIAAEKWNVPEGMPIEMIESVKKLIKK